MPNMPISFATTRPRRTRKPRCCGLLEGLYLTFSGDQEGFDKVRESGAILKKSLLPKGQPSEDELNALGKYLMTRLDNMDKIRQEIAPDWTDYREAHRELDRLLAEAITNLNRYRITVLVWVRGHQKMASGVTNPAAWFDINEAPGKLLNLGVKAVF